MSVALVGDSRHTHNNRIGEQAVARPLPGFRDGKLGEVAYCGLRLLLEEVFA